MHILTRLRTNKGLSKNALATKAGVNVGFVGMVETYRRSLPVPVAMKIAEVLDTDGAELHYEALLAGCMAKLVVEYPDVSDDYIKSVAERIVKKKHAYMMAEYEEMKLLDEASAAI